jgi:hypothetical protein
MDPASWLIDGSLERHSDNPSAEQSFLVFAV